jgi:hypothetical protein
MRLADLAYRRRARMLLALLLLPAVTVVVAPRLAGDFSSEFETQGTESQKAAHLVSDRFAGISGDSIDVVWQASAGACCSCVLIRPVLRSFSRYTSAVEASARQHGHGLTGRAFSDCR